MASSFLLIWLICAGVGIATAAEVQHKGSASGNSDTNNNDVHHQEKHFKMDPPSSKHLTNAVQSHLPLMYRSMGKNPSTDNRINNPGHPSQKEPEGKDKLKSISDSMGQKSGQGGNFFWPKTLPPFSSSSKSPGDDKPGGDQPTKRNDSPKGSAKNEEGSKTSQFFETPVAPPDFSGPKTGGVAFWPRNFDSPNPVSQSSSSMQKKLGDKDDSLTKVFSRGNPDMKNRILRKGPEGSSGHKSNHEEQVKHLNEDSVFTSFSSFLEFQNGQSEERNRQSHKSQVGPLIDPLLGGDIEASPVVPKYFDGVKLNNINGLEEDYLSSYLPREDLTTNRPLGYLESHGVPMESLPPISVSDSNFKLPEASKMRLLGTSQRIQPVIDMGEADMEESASTLDSRRRWGQDVPDRLKEIRRNLRNKQNQVPSLTSQSAKSLLTQVNPETSEMKLATSTPTPPISKGEGAKERKEEESEPWSAMSMGQRRLRLSRRLAELMLKNRVSRRARMFREIEKIENTKEVGKA